MATTVLIVLDGGFRFRKDSIPDAADIDFTYSTLVDALVAEGMAVTCAHRQDDSTATAGWTDFDFNAPPAGHTLSEFDVIWMIGLQGRNVALDPVPNTTPSGINGLTDLQLRALSRYMDAGGGVFATGDHDSIGADMAGRIPRVRAMRAWFGEGDSNPDIPAGLPRNNPRNGATRRDTTRRNPDGWYDAASNPAGVTNHVWFENQSDSIPQPVVAASSPAHPILRRGAAELLKFPDHMHEGKCLGDVGGYDYEQVLTFVTQDFKEFRTIDAPQERPEIIASGSTVPFASRDAVFGAQIESAATSNAADVPVLSVYDGRAVGVGRVVTGSTFHHYVDINLTGDTDIVMGTPQDRTGADAAKDVGFNADMTLFNEIKAIFVNITNWLAKPRPAITLNLERSTFGEDEIMTDPHIAGAVRVVVDGVKPSEFPGGPVNPGPFNPAWAPVVTPTGAPFIAITPVSVSSDDPGMPERLQRFTFIYDVDFSSSAFGDQTVPVEASLTLADAPDPPPDTAFFQLVTTANPFMMDQDGGTNPTWLSTDLKVFRVVAGENKHGHLLPDNATRADAFTYINAVKNSMTAAEFGMITGDQQDSALSSLPTTTMSGENVYNFALARVRRAGTILSATDVRVYFRLFVSQTTAALTYHGGVGDGYPKTGGIAPIALPAQSGGQWLSFPCFSEDRNADPNAQDDNLNVLNITAAEHDKFFGVLLDTNLDVNYLPLTPGGGGGNKPLRDLLAGDHQCLVAQIQFAGTPIPNNATPWTSDKLSQRNIAINEVANPGMAASRAAFHTFEIEATPQPIVDGVLPDELLLDWSPRIPDNSFARIHIPSWNAHEVVALADRLYPRHQISAVDDRTIEIPAGGMRYVPLPRCLYRQTGVLTVELPLGIKKGQRFDLSVRQITNRGRDVRWPIPKVQEIPLAEAAKLIDPAGKKAGVAGIRKGVFDLGGNRTLVTDLSIYDAEGDYALLIEHPDPALVAKARADSRMWRETIGAFQLGIPVSTRKDMALDQMRLFSLMQWRLAHMPRQSRWYATMRYYVGLLEAKVQALGGNPWEVPATPDGAIPQLPWVKGNGDGVPGGGEPDGGGTVGSDGVSVEDAIRKLAYPWGCLLVAILLLALLWLLLH